MRLLWILLMLVGVIGLGGAALVGFAGVEIAGRVISFRPHIILLLLLGAGACAAGMFMSPREFKEATKPLGQTEVQRPAWLDDLAKPAETSQDSDKRE